MRLLLQCNSSACARVRNAGETMTTIDVEDPTDYNKIRRQKNSSATTTTTANKIIIINGAVAVPDIPHFPLIVKQLTLRSLSSWCN
jgi:hypothetical protein